MATPLDALREKRAGIQREIEALKASVAAQNRAEFTTEELENLSNLMGAFDRVTQQIEAYEKTESITATMAQSQGRKTAPEGIVTSTPVPTTSHTPTFSGGTLVSASYGNHGFAKGMSEWLGAVKMSSYGKTDPRLISAAQTTYGQESVGPDGGFSVPPDFSTTLTSIITGEASLLGMFKPITTSSNMLVLPTDETTPWGTAGIYAEWLGEGGTMTARKPSIKQVNVNLFKVGVLIHMSDELAADSPAIQSHITRKIANALAGKVNDALINGDGVQKPLGLANAPGLVTSATTSTALVAVDLATMLSRMPPESIANAFWVFHSTVFPKLWTLTLGQIPIYMPDIRVSPWGTLLGKPIIMSEYCQTVGTIGDAYLFSPDGYAAAMKSTGIDTQASIHFAFDQGLQSFRAVMRVGGTPLASAPITRKNGSATLSHIINLQTRTT